MAVKDHVQRAFFPIVSKLDQKQSKFIYRYVTRRRGADDFLFLNTGYEEDPPMALPLDASEERNRFCIQFYHRVAAQVDLRGKQVLEVGSGHGGGAVYLKRSLHPANYIGLDLNPDAIAFCRQTHRVDGLEFVHGDAENLPFPDESFDVVINIESSLHYSNFRRFLAEVVRVLRPGGHFLYTDFRPSFLIDSWEAALAEAPMRQLSQTEINAEVVRGVEKNLPQWLKSRDRSGRAFLPGLARNYYSRAMTKGSEKLQSNDLSYRIYCFAK